MSDKKARARQLRASGWTYERIAQELGIGTTTVYRWTAPGAAESDRRRDRRQHTCVDCGCSVYGSKGERRHSHRCRRCQALADKVWTEGEIVAAMHRFAARYNRRPRAADFNTAQARARGHGWRADRFYADGDYPPLATVQRTCGSWSAALVAAGFSPTGIGGYPRLNRAGLHLEVERKLSAQ